MYSRRMNRLLIATIGKVLESDRRSSKVAFLPPAGWLVDQFNFNEVKSGKSPVQGNTHTLNEYFKALRTSDALFLIAGADAEMTKDHKIVIDAAASFSKDLFIHSEGDPSLTRFLRERFKLTNIKVWSGALEYSLAHVRDALARSRSLDSVENQPSDQITISFAPELTPFQVTETLTALANYFRACGGAGMPAEFEFEQAEVFHHVG
jgi:hypothetical protein